MGWMDGMGWGGMRWDGMGWENGRMGSCVGRRTADRRKNEGNRPNGQMGQGRTGTDTGGEYEMANDVEMKEMGGNLRIPCWTTAMSGHANCSVRGKAISPPPIIITASTAVPNIASNHQHQHHHHHHHNHNHNHNHNNHNHRYRYRYHYHQPVLGKVRPNDGTGAQQRRQQA